MKKSNPMRLAAILLIMTLMTSHIYSGTLAKYVTSDTAGDSARVAKWGVELSVTGNLFGEKYETYTVEENGNEQDCSNQISVTAEGNVETVYGGDIVAPGTRNSNGLTIKISGTPEVATQLKWKMDAEDIYLGVYDAGGTTQTYGLMIKAQGVTANNVGNFYYMNSTDPISFVKAPAGSYVSDKIYYVMRNQFTLAERADGATSYYPLKWTLKILDLNETIYDDENKTMILYAPEMEFKGIKDVVAKMNEYMSYKNADGFDYDNNLFWTNYDANEPIDIGFNITWEWAYQDAQNEEMLDAADTILGNLTLYEQEIQNQADIPSRDWFVVKDSSDSTGTYVLPVKQTEEQPGNYSLETMFDIIISATQID